MNKIQEVLDARGIKQVEVATALGVAKSTVSMYCSNVMQPSISNLIKLSELLDCSVSDLLIVKGKKGKGKNV
jgi:transcriptional regulator with XRE-family HTH domain